MPRKAENVSVHELRRLSNVRMCTMGVSAPSLRRESTDSLICCCTNITIDHAFTHEHEQSTNW